MLRYHANSLARPHPTTHPRPHPTTHPNHPPHPNTQTPHLVGEDDLLVKVSPLLAMIGNWQEYLSLSEKDELALFKKHERTGRPLGNESFIDRLEGELSLPLRPQKPGPKVDVK